MNTGCRQQVVVLAHPPGTTMCRHLEACGLPCEFRYSKKLRKVGATSNTYKYCAVHRRLRRLYGKDDPRTMRPAQRQEEKKP